MCLLLSVVFYIAGLLLYMMMCSSVFILQFQQSGKWSSDVAPAEPIYIALFNVSAELGRAWGQGYLVGNLAVCGSLVLIRKPISGD